MADRAGEPADSGAVLYDREEQLEKIQAGLVAGERLEAVFDLKGGGTGYVGITDRRLVIEDKAFMRRMKAIVSVPYSRIHSIAAEDEGGLLTGRGFWASSRLIVTTSAGAHELEFRSADKAHAAHDLILRHLLR
jgi:hypothetical protein